LGEPGRRGEGKSPCNISGGKEDKRFDNPEKKKTMRKATGEPARVGLVSHFGRKMRRADP